MEQDGDFRMLILPWVVPVAHCCDRVVLLLLPQHPEREELLLATPGC